MMGRDEGLEPEALWVVTYVLLGRFFGDRVQAMSDLLGDFTWALVGLLVAAVLGWLLFKNLRAQEPEPTTEEPVHDLS